jgi:L-arabinokinase
VATVLFYISGHGFGHASRDVEVINVLGERGCRILIRSAVSASLLARTIRVPFDLLPGACDTGIVQISSLDHDDSATVAEAVAFYDDFPARIGAEVEKVAPHTPAAIVGDIPPLAFEVAARLGVPGIAMGNFTWDWIYETYPGFLPAGAQALPTIRDAYRKATLALQLPFSAGFGLFEQVRRIPLVARRPSVARELTRRELGWPAKRRIALASFGGYGLPALDLGTLDCAGAWTIATTDRVSPERSRVPAHVSFVSESRLGANGLRYENLVAAVDAVVTKPGYGILSECISAGTPLLYTSRGAFREYDLLVREMPRVVRCRFIAREDLMAGRWRAPLEALLDQAPAPETLPANGAPVAADLIMEYVPRD